MSAGVIRKLHLVLTARCNLSCSYCYQNAKTARRMSWPTLRRALDLGLASRAEAIEFVFFGGEPLLEFPLMQRSVTYVNEHRRPDLRVSYGLVTNGTLLTDEVASFLDRHSVDTQLSFDGTPEVQDARGRGTFRVLDARLEDLKRRYRRFFDRLTVSMTLTPKAIDFLASSVAYFLDKGVQRIAISPTFTHEAGWEKRSFERLNDEFDRILEFSLDVYERTGAIPVLVMRKPDTEVTPGRGGLTMCGVSRAETPTVDVDGQIHGCATFADSFQSFRRAFLATRIDALRMGAVGEADYGRVQSAYGARVKDAGLFHDKQDKYSSLGICRTCEYLTRCSVCPMSIGHLPGNTDVNRVPDFLCAYNLVSLAYQDRFDRMRRELAAATRLYELSTYAANHAT